VARPSPAGLDRTLCARDSCPVSKDEQASAADSEFYDTTYGSFADQLNATIRSEAFGEEIGQNSWLTADEHRRFFTWLELGASSDVLEMASGSGGPALFMVRETGCRVTGVDLHDAAVDAANAAAAEEGLSDRARFLRADARERLPLDDRSFDALLCIDSINHMYERARVLGEWHRVLRSGGRLLFTDPITVTGMIRREEMVARSGSMGEFVFTAPGLDETLLKAAGFEEIQVEDVTPNTATVAAAWQRARARHAADLDRVEGAEANARFQEFLGVVERLASERRLSRLAYLARKP
jgi:SAM-dependent methyltransferase